MKKKKFKEIYPEFFDRKYDQIFMSTEDDENIILSLSKTIYCIKNSEVHPIKLGPEKFIVFSLNNRKIDSIGFDGNRHIKYNGSTFLLSKKLIR